MKKERVKITSIDQVEGHALKKQDLADLLGRHPSTIDRAKDKPGAHPVFTPRYAHDSANPTYSKALLLDFLGENHEAKNDTPSGDEQCPR